MLKKIFFTIIIFCLSTSPALANLKSVPVNQNKQSLQPGYTVNLYSGSASYEYPVKMPPGTHGLAPNPEGIGWKLNNDYADSSGHSNTLSAVGNSVFSTDKGF